MGDYMVITALVALGVSGWLLYLKIKHQPGLFSAEVLQSASFTLGLLALFLIALISFFVVTM